MKHVNEIQTLWMEMVGFDPSKIDADGHDRHHHWDLRGDMDALKRAKELDPSNALFLMLIEEYLDSHLKTRSVTAYSYLDDPKPFDAKLDQARRMRQLLAASGMLEAREELRSTMTRALTFYGAGERDDVKKLVAERGSVAWLWRDALEALEQKLEIHQFLAGEAETTKPLYQEYVLGFWTIGDALRLSSHMPSGISICMIRDPEAIHSYFAFVVRNGGRLWVITDRTNWTHPLQSRMSRKPERHLDSRMAKARFPYELLNIEYVEDEDGEIVGINVPRQEGIIPIQTRAFKIRKVSEVAADEVTWIAMMFALLTRKFFVEGWQAPELSYTGEMVDLPQLMAAVADEAGLPARAEDYHPLSVEPLRSAELTTDRVYSEGMIRGKRTGHNEWMLQRYASKIDDTKLNLIDAPQQSGLYLKADGELVRLTENETRYGRAAEKAVAKLETFDITYFGGKERLLADRIWVGRYNQAKLINVEAKKEFETRKTEIEAWWEKRINANMPALKEAILRGTFYVDSQTLQRDFTAEWFENAPRGRKDILRRGIVRTGKMADKYEHDGKNTIESYAGGTSGLFFGGYDHPRGYRCFDSGRPARDLVLFEPRVADDLAALAGVKREDLPDVLQHWTSEAPYVGNSILDRLDPLEWAAKNPWTKLNFVLKFFVSHHAYPWPEVKKDKEVSVTTMKLGGSDL